MTVETETLATLVDARHHCLGQLHLLGERQLESIAERDFSKLMKVLAAKQRLLANLQQIQQHLEPFRGQPPESRPWASAERRRHCAAVAAECERLLSEIVKQEQQSERMLEAVRNQAAEGLQMTHSASQAHGAYAAAADNLPIQLDLCTDGS